MFYSNKVILSSPFQFVRQMLSLVKMNRFTLRLQISRNVKIVYAKLPTTLIIAGCW